MTLSQEDHDSTSEEQEKRNTTSGALLCSLVHIARVVKVHVIVDGVLGVMIFVLIGHDEVLVIYVEIFVLISVTGDVLFTPPVGDSELCWLLPI